MVWERGAGSSRNGNTVRKWEAPQDSTSVVRRGVQGGITVNGNYIKNFVILKHESLSLVLGHQTLLSPR